MGKIGQLKSPPPIPLEAATMAKKLQVVAADHGGARSGETNHRVSQGRSLPRIGGDTFCAIESCRYVAIAGAVRSAIGGLHHQAQAPALLNCHSRVRRHGSPVTDSPKSDQSLDPAEGLGIQGDQGRQRTAGLGAGKEKKLGGDPTVMDRVRSLRAVTLTAQSNERQGGLGRQEIR